MEATTVGYSIWHSSECCVVSVVNVAQCKFIAHLPLLVMGNPNTTGHLSFYHRCMIYAWGIIWNTREDTSCSIVEATTCS